MWVEILKKLGPAKDSFSPEQLALLKRDIDEEYPQLSTRLIHFLKTGENMEILDLANNLPTEKLGIGFPSFGFIRGTRTEHLSRKAFFESLNTQDTVLLTRLTAVIDALRDKHQHLDGDHLNWRRALIAELFWVTNFQGDPEISSKVTCQSIEAVFVGTGEQYYSFLSLLLTSDKLDIMKIKEVVPRLIGFKESYLKYADLIFQDLKKITDDTRIIITLKILRDLTVLPRPDVIVDFALHQAKAIRPVAEEVVEKFTQECLPIIQDRLVNGTAEQRLFSGALLAKTDPEGFQPYLEKQFAVEKSRPIRAELQRLLKAIVPVAVTERELERIPIPDDLQTPITPALKVLIQDTLNRMVRSIPLLPKYLRWEPADVMTLDEMVNYLQGENINLCQRIGKLEGWVFRTLFTDGEAILASPDLTPFQLFRLAQLTNESDTEVVRYFTSRNRRPKFRELAIYMEQAGYTESAVLKSLVWKRFKGLDRDGWEYLVDRLETTRKMLCPSARATDSLLDGTRYDRIRLLKYLANLPYVPAAFHEALWDLALKGQKDERPLAQAVLDMLPNCASLLIDHLKEGDAEVRLRVANWIERQKYLTTLPALEAALKKEKGESTRSALFNALEALGGSLEPYLDRAKLLAEAKAGLKKELPLALSWMPWNALPELAWEESGKPVEPEILKWFLVQSLKLKQPSSLMCRQMARIRKREREAAARIILTAWMGLGEKKTITRAEAEAKAEVDLEKMLDEIEAAKTQGVLCQQFNYAEKHRQRTQIHLHNSSSSSSACKGVLQVVGAMAGTDVVPLINTYLKTWYGMQVSQCKALLGVLAMMDQPVAIQLLLSVRNKFRTKSIQEEADRVAEELAERKGWTLDEMADRTIPDAGFDEKGVMELCYGPRIFTAKLAPEFAIVLTDSTGKAIKGLPEPGKNDDAELAADAKKELSASRKEFKAVVSLQRDRLYEAMCTQRTWPLTDWEAFLAKHPIVGRLCQWLVWGEVTAQGKLCRLFRPMGDGSYTDEGDSEVKLAPKTVLKLAHASLVSDESAQAWLEQFNDYHIIPTFRQFGHTGLTLTKEKAESTELTNFQGYLLESFKLRGRMSKQGYTRGPAADGGWFMCYIKRLMGLGIEAHIEFSGSPLPEENKTVALTQLKFYRKEEQGSSEMALGEVPPVFLWECYHDVSLAAADGTGFDANWQTTVN